MTASAKRADVKSQTPVCRLQVRLQLALDSCVAMALGEVAGQW